MSAIAFQKTSKIKRSPVVQERSPCRKTQKQSDRLTENLKNQAITCCERVSAIPFQKTSKIKRSLVVKE
ncbi:MAG: hypothetical protein ACYT04_59235 [Nostoc sp.]